MNWGSSVCRLKVLGSHGAPWPPLALRATYARQSLVVSTVSQGNWLSRTWGRSSLSFLRVNESVEQTKSLKENKNNRTEEYISINMLTDNLGYGRRPRLCQLLPGFQWTGNVDVSDGLKPASSQCRPWIVHTGNGNQVNTHAQWLRNNALSTCFNHPPCKK